MLMVGLRKVTKMQYQVNLKRSILYFCCNIDDGLYEERLSMVLGINGSPLSESLLSLWSKGGVDEACLLSGALILNSISHIPLYQRALVQNARSFLWLEFAARSSASSRFGDDFHDTYNLRKEGLLQDTDEQVYASQFSPLLKAYFVVRSVCFSIENSLKKPAPKWEEDDAHLYQVMSEVLQVRRQQEQQEFPMLPDAPQSQPEPPPANPQPKGKPKQPESDVDEAKFAEVKNVVGDSFSDDQIRSALRIRPTVEGAINYLFG